MVGQRRVDDVGEGGAAAAHGRDQQQVEGLPGGRGGGEGGGGGGG